MRRCGRPKLVRPPPKATISPSTMKSTSACAASAAASSGYVPVISFLLRVMSRTAEPSRNARQRSPSSLRSKIQPGSENRSGVSVASSGSSHAGSDAGLPGGSCPGPSVPLICPPQLSADGAGDAVLDHLPRMAGGHAAAYPWTEVARHGHDAVLTPPLICPPQLSADGAGDAVLDHLPRMAGGHAAAYPWTEVAVSGRACCLTSGPGA